MISLTPRSLRRTVFSVSLLGLLSLASPLVADSYKVDADHTAVVFKVKHMQFSYTYGRFNDIAGSFTTGERPSFEFTIKAASIDTHLKKRDDQLRGPDFFNANQFPVITFKSTEVENEDGHLKLTGDLTLHGVTKPISVDLHHLGKGNDPWGAYRTGYSTEFTIKRSDFGMKNMLEMVGDDVTLMISFEGIRE